MTTLGDALEFAGVPERIARPGEERFVTLKVKGGGAVQRQIKDGKTPVPFTGYRVSAGQFIYSRIDARNGAFAIVPPELDGAVVSKDFPIFRIRAHRVEPSYLLHYMRAGQLKGQIRRASFGATNRQRIAEETLLGFEMPLPPLSEQRRIAAILDRADIVRAKRRTSVAFLMGLAKSMHEESTSDATEVSVGELLENGILQVHKDGNHGSLYPRADEFSIDGVPFLTARAIADDGSFREHVDHLREEKANQLRIGWIEAGDVLLSHNASVGKVAIYTGQFGNALIGTSLTCFRPDPSRMDSRFLAASLRADSFQRQLTHNMSQTTRNQVPITAQRSLSLKWVEMEVQHAFADQVQRVTMQIEKTQRASRDENELFASLQSHAFRGEL